MILFMSQIAYQSEAGANLADGFYVLDESDKSLMKISIIGNDSQNHDVRVNSYTNLSIKAVHYYSLKPTEDIFQVQISVVSSDTNWIKRIPILVIHGKPYIELTRNDDKAYSANGPISIPSTITLKVKTENEAKALKKYLIENSRVKK